MYSLIYDFFFNFYLQQGIHWEQPFILEAMKRQNEYCQAQIWNQDR